MGLILGRRNLISNDIINQNIQKNNPNIENYFNHRSYRRGIEIQMFRDEILKESNPEFIIGIFNLFSYRNEMSFSDLKYFYTMFNPNYLNEIRISKIKFIGELLFNQQNYIEEKVFEDNLNLYFSNEKSQSFYKIINQFIKTRTKIQKRQKSIIYKDEFINLIKNQHSTTIKALIDDMIASKLLPSSKINKNNIKCNYYCDCVKPKLDKEKTKKGIEEKYREMYMDRLIKYTRDYSYEELELKLKKEYKINPILIKAIFRYFKKKTLKNIINGINFIDLLYRICLAKSEKERIDLSFEILSFPNTKEIPGKNLEEIFENEKEKPKIKKLTKDEYIQIFTDSVEPNLLTNFIKSISNSFDELNLYPYISGHEKAFEKDIIKSILVHYKEGKSYDEICKEKMKNEKYFYAVDGEFIINLDKYLDDKIDEKPIIKTDKICNKDLNLENYLKPNLIYQTDFYIVPNKIYDFFKEYFNIEGCDIIFKKIIYKEKDITHLTKEENEHYHPGQKDLKIKNDEGDIIEIEFYPIHIKIFLAKDIYNYLKKKENNISQIAGSNELMIILQKLYDGKKRSSRSQMVSRMEFISKIIEKEDYNYTHLENPNIFFFTSSNFHNINLNSTYESERIYHHCIIIIDSKFDDKYSYITQMQYIENEDYVKEQQKKYLEKLKEEEIRIKEIRKKEEEERRKNEEELRKIHEENKKKQKELEKEQE